MPNLSIRKRFVSYGPELFDSEREDGPILLTQGSSVLLQTLLAHDLIDEFRLLTFPLVLGPGKRLFSKGTSPGALKLAATTVSTTGVVMSVYDRRRRDPHRIV